jgi:hypothetical protein
VGDARPAHVASASVGKGYAEGPAAEERFEALERGEGAEEERPRQRQAVYGATPDNPEKHFLGWRDEVDPDALFASGEAWGLSVVLTSDERR